MTIAFQILMHLVLFAGAVFQLYLIPLLIMERMEGEIPYDSDMRAKIAALSHDAAQAEGARYRIIARERFMRGFSVAAALLLYLGAKAAGISIPTLAFSAMSSTLPGAIIGGFLFPSAVGLVVSWYIVRHLNGSDRRKDAVAVRVLLLVLSVVFFLYCDSYIYAFATAGGSVYYLPNLVFALSAMLYAIFKYHPYAEAPA